MDIVLADIAQTVEGEIRGDANKRISGAAPFEAATDDHITLAATPRFLTRMAETCAGAIIVPRAAKPRLPVDSDSNLIFVDNPQAAFARVLSLFHPPADAARGFDPRACAGKDFRQGSHGFVGPFTAIGDHVSIGDRSRLHANVVIGNHVAIGDDVTIYPNVTIMDGCRIGNRVTVHAGTVIGSDGFGFAPDGEQYVKIPHTGIVQIDDDVEIGANNTIDRATFGKTWIKSGTKTDNLVHIAHNVTVGENSVVVAQVGVAGSTSIGKHAVIAGQAGIGGHLKIGNNVTIGPQAGVAQSVSDNSIVSGTPEMPHRLWLRVSRIIPTLPELKKKVKMLEKRLGEIEKK